MQRKKRWDLAVKDAFNDPNCLLVVNLPTVVRIKPINSTLVLTRKLQNLTFFVQNIRTKFTHTLKAQLSFSFGVLAQTRLLTMMNSRKSTYPLPSASRALSVQILKTKHVFLFSLASRNANQIVLERVDGQQCLRFIHKYNLLSLK